MHNQTHSFQDDVGGGILAITYYVKIAREIFLGIEDATHRRSTNQPRTIRVFPDIGARSHRIGSLSQRKQVSIL